MRAPALYVPPMTTRTDAIARARAHHDSGAFADTLGRLVAIPTESQNPERAQALEAYLADAMRPAFAAMGFDTEIVRHPAARGPFLIARRREGEDLPTVLGYGHGDVIRGQDERWADASLVDAGREGRRVLGPRHGRTTRASRDRHGGVAAVLETRGRVGFNAIFLIEMGVGGRVARAVAMVARARGRGFAGGPLLRRLRRAAVFADRPDAVFSGSRGGYPGSTSLVGGRARARHHLVQFSCGLLANPAI